MSPDGMPDGSSKEKKQLVILGVLGVILVGVVVVQFSASEEGSVQGGVTDATAAVALASSPDSTANMGQQSERPANPVLAAEPDGDLTRSPFEAFWSFAAPLEEVVIENVPPPTAVLNATLTSGPRPIALIDGKMRYLGDVVQQWRIESIGSREVTLRSPTNAVTTLSMPLLDGKIRQPPGDPDR